MAWVPAVLSPVGLALGRAEAGFPEAQGAGHMQRRGQLIQGPVCHPHLA